MTGTLIDRKTNQELHHLTLVRAEKNNNRNRCQYSSKGIGSDLNINKARKNKFDMIKGAFGQKWCFKNKHRSTPSITEVVKGLGKYYNERIEELLEGHDCEDP